MSDEHSSFIKTPKQLAIVVVLAFAVPVTLVALLSQLVTGVSPGSGSESEADVLNRIRAVGQVTLAEASAPTGNQTGEQVYEAVCKTCHESGLAGAPKFGDKAAWAPRIKTGANALYTSAINGKNAMPPKGGNAALTDIELQRAVVYMANHAGASFKEPEAPAAAPAPAAATASAAAAPAPVPAPSFASAAPATSPLAGAAPGAPLDMASATAMMQKDGCATCHAVDKKIVGPAYQDVAAKYKGDKAATATLVQKVKTGGSGVWGQVPMPANAQVPDADVKALVSWILTLKK
jgi:cytochrome c5